MMEEQKKIALVTFAIEAVVRKDTTIEDLIRNQTEFIFEPRTANGCVTDQKVTEIKEL